MTKKLTKKNYTEKEIAFLDALFDPDTKGDIRTAMDKAGYSKNTRPNEILKALGPDILEASEQMLTAHAPKAVMGVIASIDNPNTLGAGVKLKASQDVLDRAGISRKDQSVNINIPAGGIVLLPPKNKDVVDITPKEDDLIEYEE